VKKVFIDANIILDFLDSKRKNHESSKESLQQITELGWEVVITEDLLTTIYYIIKDKQRLLDFYSVIFEEWDILSFGTERLKEAVSICKTNSSQDFEDVIQSLSARDSSCNLIISNDRNFHDCGITIITSADFIKQV